MEDRILESINNIFGGLLSFIGDNLNVILAFFLFVLSYKLFKLAIQKTNTVDGSLKFKEFSILCFPAVFISLFGTVFVINLAQMDLLIVFLLGSLLAGIAFAGLGYSLFVRGIFGESDLEAVWQDKSLLLKKASPGTLFALFGVAVIVFSLWKGTSMVNSLQSTQAAMSKDTIAAIDRNVPEVLRTIEKYLDSHTGTLESADTVGPATD